MSTIHIKHHHGMTHEEMRERVEQIARYLKRRYKGAYSWHGNSLRFQRSGASGSVELGDGYVELRVKLGLLLVPKKNEIETLIRQHIPTAMGELAG